MVVMKDYWGLFIPPGLLGIIYFSDGYNGAQRIPGLEAHVVPVANQSRAVRFTQKSCVHKTLSALCNLDMMRVMVHADILHAYTRSVAPHWNGIPVLVNINKSTICIYKPQKCRLIIQSYFVPTVGVHTY